jgi:hypothetical protein
MFCQAKLLRKKAETLRKRKQITGSQTIIEEPGVQ